MSIKDLLVRLRIKGKTRGRPSKLEMTASKILSWQMEKNKPEIHKAQIDMMIYGTGCIKVMANGKMKCVKIRPKNFKH